MSSIQAIVEKALREKYLTPAMEAEVGRLCDVTGELPVEEYKALDRLMGSLLTGEVVAMPQKQFINVMEELVISEAISRIAEVETLVEQTVDIGDVAAYALNRLPPLYATTEEGAEYQRQRAIEQLKDLIVKEVEEGINRFLDQPVYFPERNIISSKKQSGIVNQVSKLLQDYAPEYEQEQNQDHS
jgi:hypothetical protein